MTHPAPRRSWLRFRNHALLPRFYDGAALVLDLNTGIADVWCDDHCVGSARTLREASDILSRYLEFAPIIEEGKNE